VQRLRLGFYAGSALRTQAGYPIGVLCVIDHQPRSFNPAEAALLERLAAVVMSLLDLRLHLLQQPAWNQQLWAGIYRRIEAPVAYLEALASRAGQGSAATSEAARAEILRIIEILAEQVQALRS
jgi:hypothetical protein